MTKKELDNRLSQAVESFWSCSQSFASGPSPFKVREEDLYGVNQLIRQALEDFREAILANLPEDPQ